MARGSSVLRRSAAAALGGLALLAAAPPAHANPPDTFGFGSRETAMGGAVAAETRGFAANYYNPAALARSRGLEIGIGYFRAEHALAMNGRDNGVDAVKGMNAGFVAPGTFLGIPFAFGVAVHLPDDRISRVRALRQEQPRWELYDNRNQRLFLAANLAIEPTPWLWIGGGLSFMSSTRGRLDISGSANVFRPDDSKLRHEVDADLTAVRYPQAGVRVALGERVALAAVYRGEFQLALDLTAHLFGDISGLTTALYDLHTRSINNFLPQQAVLGGSWAVTDRLKTTLDATWINWSAYVAPVAKLDAVLEIPPPPSGWPSTVTPPTTPAPTRVESLKMYDRIVPRVGLEWHALGEKSAKGFLRAGYELAKSPIAAQSGLTNYVDRDRHSLSLGVGGAFQDLLPELPGTLTIDGHVQVSRLSTETTRKASAADYVGDYTAGGSILNVGITAGFAFDKRRDDATAKAVTR
ncbi:MAG: outer membrane protein transport protein [Labilithrix sp.]|nr:outer membrane protein transport protein [Labilithrix sp.]